MYKVPDLFRKCALLKSSAIGHRGLHMITMDKDTMGRLNKTAHVIQFSLRNSKGIMGYV